MEDNNIMVLPFLALRGLTVFPDMLLTFDVERDASLGAISMAMNADRLIFLATQKEIAIDLPEEKDIYTVGTVCRIRQQLRQPQGKLCRVMVEGLYRAESAAVKLDPTGYTAMVVRLEDKEERVREDRMEAMLRRVITLFEEYLELNPESVNEQIISVLSNPEPEYVAGYIAQNVAFSFEKKQELLEEVYLSKRLSKLAVMLRHEISVAKIEKELAEATQEQINKGQREYYLREEMKVIEAELGEEGQVDDISEYRSRIEQLQASEEVKAKLNKELGRLKKQPFGSSEAAVIRGYLDTCLEIPWGVTTSETIDISKAAKILDEDHYGLDKVKKRVLEYLAVRQLSPDMKGGLICLAGPPGTGKTSIAMSIAKATGRKLCRISLGGVHDESEIRGHRKTYIGSMPGRIINGVIQAGSSNPLMVLDEIDKLGSDYRGDPSAALLEVLDPEQNSNFRDHFLELPFDLSDVFFITTANDVSRIPRPLLDRMELIELSSYTDEEKLQIAKKHLVPKQRKKHGLTGRQLRIPDDTIRRIIDEYTRESGVRVLERSLASVCRRTAFNIADGRYTSATIRPGSLEEYLGVPHFSKTEKRFTDEVGLVRGLAYTTVGGTTLDVETAVVKGNGKVVITGNLGDVMKESAQAAITYIRSRAERFGIEEDFYTTKDIHIHFPEGATPKDGPSAGITMCIALISALTGKAVRHNVAMTGEITIRGRILPIGGLREKTMAAYKAGVTEVIIPFDNVPNLEDIDPVVRDALEFVPVSSVDDALDTAFGKGAFSPVGQDIHITSRSEKASVRQ